jgi:hypothetical protein
MGMTWKLKVVRVVFGLGVVAALAMASGASWTEFCSAFGLA